MKKVAGVFFLFFLVCFSPLEKQKLLALPEVSSEPERKLDEIRSLVENEPESAIGRIQDILETLDPDKNPAMSSAAYALLADAYYYLDNLDPSLMYYHKAADINQLAGRERTTEQITILGNIGFVYDLKEQHLVALGYYDRALGIARELDNKSEIAANLANIGKIKTLQGFYREALLHMEEALAIDRGIGDPSVVATDLNTIGRIYEAWGMFDKAVEYLTEALEINQELKQKDKVAIRYSGLGLVYKAWGKYDLALEYFDKALVIDRELKNDDKVALRHANIGSTYLAMGQVDKAILYLNLGYEFFENNRMYSYSASILTDLGRCHLEKGNFAEAEAAFLRSIEYSRPGHLKRNIMNSLEQLAELYRQTGRYEKAYGALEDFMHYKDSLFDAESQKKISEFQVKYDLDIKQQENEILRRDRELAQKRHTNARLFFSLLALFLVIILLALAIRLKINQNRRLKAEKENQALRADLEQRNKELTYNAMCIVKNNETMVRMVEAVDAALSDNDGQHDLKNIIHQLQKMEQEKSWEDFEVRFIQTHQGFYEKLQERFPELTPNERKLCAFLRLNMSTKDIAAITHQSVNSINVARTRLRKKLGIDGTDENLVGFLHSL